MPLIKTNVPGYYKDTDTNAIINTSDEYQKYKQQRDKSKDYDALKNKVNKMENDISDIKNLLLQLVNGKN
jgi:hypothetical protein